MPLFKIRETAGGTFLVVGDHSIPIRRLPTGVADDDNYVAIDTGTTVNKVTVGDLFSASGGIRYNAAQSLTPAQKQQARENIGVSSGGAGAVRYDEAQSLTSSETAQARENIDAIAIDQGIYTGSSAPSDTNVKNWIDTSEGLLVDAGFVFGNVWDISLPTSGWTLSSGKYVQTVSALGLDHHFVLLAWIDDASDAQLDAYSLIEDVKSDSDGYVTVVCSAQPSVAFTIKVKYHESTEQKTFDDLEDLGATTHKNLLDNGWFTVNQRGASGTWGSNSYGVDRWQCPANGVTISNTNNIITINTSLDGEGLIQYQEDSFAENLFGKIATISVKYNDGSISSSTVTFPSSFDGVWRIVSINSSTKFRYIFRTQANGCSAIIISSTVGTPISIKAVKLELGSVSTLAYDTAPNYAEELAKCQRYFIKYDNYVALTANYFYENRLATDMLFYPTRLRTTPTVTINSALLWVGTWAEISPNTDYNYDHGVSFIISGSGLLSGQSFLCLVTFSASADL